MSVKLNIGSGRVQLPGFINIDKKLGTDAFPLPKFVENGQGPVELADGTVDEIRASHILEHFPTAQVPRVLQEWVRVLKPGGVIRIAVPDVERVMDLRSNDENWHRYLMGGQTDENDVHLSAFDQRRLRGLMTMAGLQDIREWQTDGLDTSCHACSLNLEGTKQAHITKPVIAGESIKQPESNMTTTGIIKIICCLSLPRLGFNDFWGGIHEALAPFKIPIARYTGAFWGQCLERVMSKHVNIVDWILCCDYDTVFTARQIDSMFGIFGQNPEIDALAPLQTRRNWGSPLLSIKGQRGVAVTGEPIKVDTAHFGCTLIRTEALRKMKHPWFVAKPGPDGTWEHDEHWDDDIAFWKQWQEVGNTVYVTPKVRVGHLELLVSDFDAEMKPRYTRVNDWREEQGLIPAERLS